MKYETLIIAGIIFISIYIISMFAYLVFRGNLKLKEKQLLNESVKLDDLRAHLEREIMSLNQQFSSSESRFRELNHLIISGQINQDRQGDNGNAISPYNFLKAHGINSNNITMQDDLVFVLTPFHDEFKEVFDSIVSTGQQLGLKVVRGDEKMNVGDIFPQLLKLIISSRFIVANISGRNPNVFYELGIAHSLGKTVILIADRKSEVPFDLRSKLIVFYETPEDIKENLAREFARGVLKSKYN